MEAPIVMHKGSARIPAMVTILVLAGVLVAAAISLLPRASSGTAWRGQRLLLVDAGIPEQQVLALLGRSGLHSVLSESTEPVALSNWVKVETIGLGVAEQRLMPMDPRRDGYLDRLSAWFTTALNGREYRIYFLREQAFRNLPQRVNTALAGLQGSFILPESGVALLGKERWLFLLATLLIDAFIIVFGAGASLSRGMGRFRRSGMVTRAALALPWLLLSAYGPVAALVAALWSAALLDASEGLVLAVEEYRYRMRFTAALESLSASGRPPITMVIVALGAVALFPSTLVAVLLCGAASLCTVGGFTLLRGAAGRSPSAGFVPLPLESGRTHGLRHAPIAVLVALLLWALLRLVVPEQGSAAPAGLRLPLPVPASGPVEPMPKDTALAYDRTDAATLPSLGQWLAHMAFEEGIALRVLGSPQGGPFAEVSLPTPSGPSHELVFDDGWARSTYRALPSSSLESMLAGQGRPVRAELRALPPSQGRPLAPMEIILYIILLIPPFRRIIAVLPALRDSSTRELRQEA